MGIFSKICFAIFLFGVSTLLAHADTTAGPDGLWSAVIVVGKAEVPFPIRSQAYRKQLARIFL